MWWGYPNNREGKDMQAGEFSVKCPKCNNDKIKLLATDELSLINPISIYAITKYTQENIISVTCEALKIPYVILRYQNVFGPGQSLINPYTGILSIFSIRIMNDNDIDIFEDGMESRDFVCIDDVVDATILSIKKREADYEIFNVGSGRSISILEVARTL